MTTCLHYAESSCHLSSITDLINPIQITLHRRSFLRGANASDFPIYFLGFRVRSLAHISLSLGLVAFERRFIEDAENICQLREKCLEKELWTELWIKKQVNSNSVLHNPPAPQFYEQTRLIIIFIQGSRPSVGRNQAMFIESELSLWSTLRSASCSNRLQRNIPIESHSCRASKKLASHTRRHLKK